MKYLASFMVPGALVGVASTVGAFAGNIVAGAGSEWGFWASSGTSAVIITALLFVLGKALQD